MTQQERIYAHYQALRHLGKNDVRDRKCQSFGHNRDDNDLILHLARHWKMPCKEIKQICRAAQRANRIASGQVLYGRFSVGAAHDIVKDGIPVYYECSRCADKLPLKVVCNCEGQAEIDS